MKFAPKQGNGDLLWPTDSRYKWHVNRLIKILLYLQVQYPQIHFKAEEGDAGFYDVVCEPIDDYKIKTAISDTIFRGKYLPEEIKSVLNELLF